MSLHEIGVTATRGLLMCFCTEAAPALEKISGTKNNSDNKDGDIRNMWLGNVLRMRGHPRNCFSRQRQRTSDFLHTLSHTQKDVVKPSHLPVTYLQDVDLS